MSGAGLAEASQSRVTFEPEENQKLTYAVRGHAVDVVNDAEEGEEGAE